jgi:hypothetical protein
MGSWVRNVKEDETGIHVVFQFEEKKMGVKTALVKPENLRIAFDLPNNDKKKPIFNVPMN